MSALSQTLTMATRGIGNYIFKKPFCVSFEITYNCNALCKHCHLGGHKGDEVRADAGVYAQRCREIKPLVAQVSGGEPLLRRDVEQIVRTLKKEGGAAYVVLTTNGALLTKQKYDSLCQAGVDSFSLSFDFPDERHDDFRGIPGLFQKIVKLLEEVKDIDNGIALSAVVQRKNFRDLMTMVEFARKWNVKMNFSTYTWLRTHKMEYMIPPEELGELREILTLVRQHKRKYDTVVASDLVMENMIEFFQNQAIPDCRAGDRFLVVNPDGTLSPCGLIIKAYESRQELLVEFASTNTCVECYTSIRANTEKSAKFLIKDSLRSIR